MDFIRPDLAGPRIAPFQAPQGDLAIIAGNGNPILAQTIANTLGVSLTPARAHLFSEGNVFVRIKENVRGKDVFIIQGCHYPVNDNFMELLFWIDAARRASAQNVTAVIPFFSYAQGDKKDEPRVSIRARVCADAIEAAGADRVLTMDLHSPQIQGFFRIPVDHLYGRIVLVNHFKSLNVSDLVVCSPDVGFAKGAAAYATLLNAPVVIGNKYRADHTETVQIVEVIGNVQDKTLNSRGAKDIYAGVTHGVLSEGAAARIAESDIKKMFITDTIENSFGPLPHNVEVVSVAHLMAAAIRSIHDRTSVSMLFPDKPEDLSAHLL